MTTINNKQVNDTQPIERVNDTQPIEQVNDTKPKKTTELKLFRIFLYKDGVKTDLYYQYINKAKAGYNLYKAKKYKKLTEYMKKNNYEINEISVIGIVENEEVKKHLEVEMYNNTNCLNNRFRTKKKSNLPTITIKNYKNY